MQVSTQAGHFSIQAPAPSHVLMGITGTLFMRRMEQRVAACLDG